MIISWGKYYLHFTGEETDLEKGSKLPKATQLITRRAGMQTPNSDSGVSTFKHTLSQHMRQRPRFKSSFCHLPGTRPWSNHFSRHLYNKEFRLQGSFRPLLILYGPSHHSISKPWGSLIYFPFQKCHRSGIIQYVTSWGWLFSLSVIS